MQVNSKKLPWLSLALLLITHSILGWLLSAADAPWYFWLVVVVAIFLLDIALIDPWSHLRDTLAFMLKSDFMTFSITVLAALLSVLMITWLDIFVEILIVTCAALLVRLDVQTSGFSQALAFWFLSIVSLVGLALGWAAHAASKVHLLPGVIG